jgi:hypothetical protein
MACTASLLKISANVYLNHSLSEVTSSTPRHCHHLHYLIKYSNISHWNRYFSRRGMLTVSKQVKGTDCTDKLSRKWKVYVKFRFIFTSIFSEYASMGTTSWLVVWCPSSSSFFFLLQLIRFNHDMNEPGMSPGFVIFSLSIAYHVEMTLQSLVVARQIAMDLGALCLVTVYSKD